MKNWHLPFDKNKIMRVTKKRMNPWVKRILVFIIVLFIAGGSTAWYIFTEKFSDTSETKADFAINALDLIHAFEKNDSLSNRKYAEKIIVVNGIVSDVERADTTVNIKMADPHSGSYIIFAFQKQHLTEAMGIKAGDSISIKGSCSGGVYSEILETEFITFKRCALNQTK